MDFMLFTPIHDDRITGRMNITREETHFIILYILNN